MAIKRPDCWVLLMLSAVMIHFSGCAAFSAGPEGSRFGDHRVNPASANQMFDKGFEQFSDQKLVLLLDPRSANTLTAQDLTPAAIPATLQRAFHNANTQYGRGNDKGKAHRSQVQDRLIAASNQRCNLYTTYLKRLSNRTNGLFGTLTTVLGGASAIVTGETAARTLGGLAGISSGTRAELNQAIFESVATSIIVPSIHLRRKEILDEIVKKRKQDLDVYTVEGAIADAIRYHGACSMDAGISQASKSIQLYQDIGIERTVIIRSKIKP